MKAEYIITADSLGDLAKARYTAVHNGWRKYLRLLIGAVCCFVSCTALFRLFSVENVETRQLLLAFWLFVFLFSLVLVLNRPLSLWIHGSIMKTDGGIGQLVVYSLDDEGISGNRFGTEQKLSWRFFTKVIVSESGILLMLAGGVCHWMPRSAFGSEDEWNAASRLVLARRHHGKA